MGRPDFGQSPAPSEAQHLDHDVAYDLLTKGPIGVRHRLLDED